jgi:uncharacterized protein (TIGR00288 family)
MNIPYVRAPHVEGAHPGLPSGAPNAALLIDFDNVTMGMRSDLSKELKTLLATDVIRGKVTVQRAYADWRRYPQYIVPLSEASVDLIFAPAYGSSKKNATDIRMAIDGMELVFTRPEIGTYILLTGDSDFSSLVLKLKEYGKYVIGVGIQESSSDILVQNCDEYYSYTSLSGLRKAGSGEAGSAQDPWSLVQRAVDQMAKRRDVMRSDRLKQVMLDLDASFDEKALGFSKFSRFLTEAAQKGLLELKKLENGQYEVAAGRNTSSGGTSSSSSRDGGRDGGRESRGRDRDSRNGRGDASRSSRDAGRDGSRDTPREATASAPDPVPATRDAAPPAETPAAQAPAEAATPGDRGAAFALLVRAIGDLAETAGGPVRDSDVKRRMLAIDGSFDESELGFAKFSHFLKQADEDGVVGLTRGENGIYEVRVPDGATPPAQAAAAPAEAPASRSGGEAATASSPTRRSAGTPAASEDDAASRRLRPRLSARRRGGKDEPPPLMEGQAVSTSSSGTPSRGADAPAPPAEPETDAGKKPAGRGRGGRKKEAPKAEAGRPEAGRREGGRKEAPKQQETRTDAPRKEAAKSPAPRAATGPAADLPELGLPSDREAIAAYLTNSYKGIGKKTAETILDAHGESIFLIMETDPDRVRSLLPAARAEILLEQWVDDVARRRAELHGPGGRKTAEPPARRRSGGGGGGRRRGGGRSTR